MTRENDEMDTEETKAKCDPHMKKSEPILEFTTEEIQDATDRLTHGKAGDSSGIKAEHMKRCKSG